MMNSPSSIDFDGCLEEAALWYLGRSSLFVYIRIRILSFRCCCCCSSSCSVLPKTPPPLEDINIYMLQQISYESSSSSSLSTKKVRAALLKESIYNFSSMCCRFLSRNIPRFGRLLRRLHRLSLSSFSRLSLGETRFGADYQPTLLIPVIIIAFERFKERKQQQQQCPPPIRSNSY